MGKARVIPSKNPLVRESDLQFCYEELEAFEARLVIAERMLHDVIISLDLLASWYNDDYDDEEDANLTAADETVVDAPDEETGVQEQSPEVEEDAEAQYRKRRNALRRTERAAKGVQDDGPKAHIATGENPAAQALGGDFAVPGATGSDPGGVLIQDAVPPRGEEGWSGDST